VIFDWLITLATTVLGPLAEALPDATIPGIDPEDASSYQPIANSLATIDQWIPILGPLQLLVFLLSAVAALLAFRLAVFVYKLIRG